MSIEIVALGVGGAFSQMYYSTAVVVRASCGTLLIDCPHPIRKMLRESRLSPPVDIGDLDAVLISHLHADHSSGLEGLLFFSRFHLQKKAVLAAHDAVLERLWPHHLAAGMDTIELDGKHVSLTLEEYANVLRLDETQCTSVGGFDVVCRRTLHHVPTFAFKIFADDRALGFSADTAFDADLIEWMSECDIILHETNEGIHTPYDRLMSLDASILQKMRLIHYPDGFDLKAARIEPMIQGVPISVP